MDGVGLLIAAIIRVLLYLIAECAGLVLKALGFVLIGLFNLDWHVLVGIVIIAVLFLFGFGCARRLRQTGENGAPFRVLRLR